MALCDFSERKEIFCRNCGEVVLHERIGWRHDGPMREKGFLFWRRQVPTTIPVYACQICRCQVSPDLNERGF